MARRITRLDISAVLPGLRALHVDTVRPHDVTFPGLLHKSVFLRVHDDVTLQNWLQDLPVRDLPLLEGWPEMQELLRVARNATAHHPGALGRAVLSVIEPGGYIQWHVDLGDYAKAHRRFHLVLDTSYDCLCYGPDDRPIRMAPGELVEWNTQVPHSSGNWGTTWRTHLLFETRRGA